MLMEGVSLSEYTYGLMVNMLSLMDMIAARLVTEANGEGKWVREGSGGRHKELDQEVEKSETKKCSEGIREEEESETGKYDWKIRWRRKMG